MPRAGTTSQRGYDREHQAERARWAPLVEQGQVQCYAVRCLEEAEGRSRGIRPGTKWHLGHTPDRRAWTGPEHERCNTSEGAIRGNTQRGNPPAPRPRRTLRPARPGARRWVL